MDPHAVPRSGPWFEGWYTRISDPGAHRSIAVIAASNLAPDALYAPGGELPGYLAILVGDANGQTRSYEFFPPRTRQLAHGSPVIVGTQFRSDTDFEWRAPGFGRVSQDEIEIDVPGELSLRVKMADRIPWAPSMDWGPEGIASFIRLIPLHWFVYSLGSKAEYALSLGDGPALAGSGFAHQEKNWGAAFPNAWIWAQAVSDDGSAHLALAGGQLRLGPASLTAWLVGYQSARVSERLSPDDLDLACKTEIDAARGTFTLDATTFGRELLIEANADGGSFAPVSIPTEQGYARNGGKESFHSHIRVRSFRTFFGFRSLLDDQEFTDAALEFGAAYNR